MSIPREKTGAALEAYLNTISSGKKEVPFIQWFLNGGGRTKQMLGTCKDGKYTANKTDDATLRFTPLNLCDSVTNYMESGKGLRAFYLNELNSNRHLLGQNKAKKTAVSNPGAN